MNGFDSTSWFKVHLSVHNLCIERFVDGFVFDPNGSSLPDVIDDQGHGGHTFLDPSFVE